MKAYKVTQYFFSSGKVSSSLEKVEELKPDTFESRKNYDVYENYFSLAKNAREFHEEAQYA